MHRLIEDYIEQTEQHHCKVGRQYAKAQSTTNAISVVYQTVTSNPKTHK